MPRSFVNSDRMHPVGLQGRAALTQQTALGSAAAEEKKPKEPEKDHIRDGYSCSLDIEQAFNFSLARQRAVGFITKLELNRRPITPEFMIPGYLTGARARTTATNSTGAAGRQKSVAVLESIEWNLGDTDPIVFVARISALARQKISMVQYRLPISVDVTVSWVVYEYDEVRRKYYVSFATSPTGNGGLVKCILQKTGGALELGVGATPEKDIQMPRNYRLSFSIVPKKGPKQRLHLAAGVTLRMIKLWGGAR